MKLRRFYFVLLASYIYICIYIYDANKTKKPAKFHVIHPEVR